MKDWPNLLLIAGTGRKVGKTTLACHLIKSLTGKGQAVIAIKLTPHFHQVCQSCETLVHTPGLLITREWSSNPVKDSSRMLEAGAGMVYFVQATDGALPLAIEFLYDKIPTAMPVVCESAGMRKLVRPGKFVFINSEESGSKNLDLLPLADIVLQPFEKVQPEFFEGQWQNFEKIPAVNTILH